jgi:F0F1-type ATP synthase assembly protein I
LEIQKKEREKSSKHNRKDQNILAKASSVTFEILALNFIIIGGGLYLNKLADTTVPWVLLAFIFLSVAATIYYLTIKFK